MQNYHIPLFPNDRYHILSRAVGSETLFHDDSNYDFFISRYHKYISPIADTYCYCLLPNHFHFLIRIKKEENIYSCYKKIKATGCSPAILPEFVMQQFSNFLNSYTKAFNKMYTRKGGLFIDSMRRVEIKNDSQFGATVFYIHKNPVHHGYCKSMAEWQWSSFNKLLSDNPTKLLRNEVLDWFGGKQGFLQYHSQPIYLKQAAGLE